jgi:hypothetical protein
MIWVHGFIWGVVVGWLAGYITRCWDETQERKSKR